jgi:hypothetical protein
MCIGGFKNKRLILHLTCSKKRGDKESMQENLKGRHHFGDLGMDGRIILKWILKE